VLVSLEVPKETCPVEIGDGLCRKELPAVSRLLRRAGVAELQQYGVEQTRIDAGDPPARVEVARLFLGGDEASVDVRATAAGSSEADQRGSQAVEQLAASGVCSESVDDLVPARVMDSFRQVPAVRERRDRNTIVVLC
jgi:hypothetical protein